MLKSSIIILLGLCSVSAFATNTNQAAGQSGAEPSINPQPLPPHDPHPDGLNPKPQVARGFGALGG
jgi:hypothetical protein